MRCPKCGKISGILSGDSENKYKCPFCSERFYDSCEKESMAELLKQFADDYGKDILLNTARINAMLMDYVPDRRKDRKPDKSQRRPGLRNKHRCSEPNIIGKIRRR